MTDITITRVASFMVRMIETKFKLYYSSKFLVLRSTKISNTFLYNLKPCAVIQLGLPVEKES